MKVIVAGSRDFEDWSSLSAALDKEKDQIDEIVCGGAEGADLMGKRWAELNDIPIVYFYPEWDKYGKAAGPIRNKLMAEYADYLIAFWNGESRGTKNMIEEMRKLGKHGKVAIYEKRK